MIPEEDLDDGIREEIEISTMVINMIGLKLAMDAWS
jgi:hypothetical protein